MARTKDKEKAIQLRLEGKSYSQIKSELGISKSTLSGWLNDMPLSNERVRELRDNSEQRIEHYRETCRKRKEKILKDVYDIEKKVILPLSKRDLFIAGLFLYWGEGGKTQESTLALSNTNPGMIRFFMHWVRNYCEVPEEKIRVKLHLYKDMNFDKEAIFWEKQTGITKARFMKPYIKDSNKSAITYKNGFGHGTCNIYIGNAILARKVLMGLKVLEDSY